MFIYLPRPLKLEKLHEEISTFGWTHIFFGFIEENNKANWPFNSSASLNDFTLIGAADIR